MAKHKSGHKAGESGRARKTHDDGSERGQGDEIHQIAGDSHPPLTTQTGGVISDDENSLRAGDRGRLCSKTIYFWRKSSILTTSASLNASSMRAVSAPTATSS